MTESNATSSTAAPAVDPELAQPVEDAAAPGPSTRDAPFSTADEEVARLLRNENINYYAVFKIANNPEGLPQLKKHYFKLSRLVHPDKCSNPDAGKAMAVVAQAYDTLNNPMKKRLYDAYATSESEKPEGMSFAEWESRPVEIPRWLERILRIPGGGFCLLILLIPVLLLLFVFMVVLYILCLPIRCFCRICCGLKLDDEATEQSEQQSTTQDTAAPAQSGQA